MYKIDLFVEDAGHEAFIKALIDRLSSNFKIKVEVIPGSVRGGKGKAITELKQYLRDLERGRLLLPDMIIVAKDANCKGVQRCYRELEQVVAQFDSSYIKDMVIYAIPDPHIERWLLLDSSAFKMVLGKGCQAPDHKCDRNRYKKLLQEAIREAGVSPLLGDIEYADDIVQAMDLERMKIIDNTLGKLVNDLEGWFEQKYGQ